MPSQPHRVERLSLSVEMPDLDSALQLRARAEDLAHRRLPHVIERVFDAFDVPDMRVELARLDLDLGTIAAGQLEDDAPAAFERALTEALTEALRHVREAAGPGRRAIPASAAALEDFDAYLVHGSPRFRGEEGFDPAHAFQRLLDTQPDALVSMLRRRALDRHVLDRLVLQIPEASLHALLALLAPADAALILAYQAELRRRYRSTPAPIPEPALRHATWVLTLEFLLREPGTQFNRRAYAAHLLRGIAAEQGIAYSALLLLIRDALGRTRRRQPVAGSLPGVLDLLIAEHESASDAPAPPAPARRRNGAGGTVWQRFKDAAGNPVTLEALTRQLSASRFIELVEQLEPAHAATILAYVAGLTALHRDAPLVALSHDGFERRLRLVVLRDLLRETRPQFDRCGWLRLVLHRLAAVGGVSYAFLLASLMAALTGLRRGLPPEGALPAAVAELAGDLPVSREVPFTNALDVIDFTISRLRRYRADEPALTTLIRGMTPETFKAVVEKLQPRHATQLLDGIAALATLQHRAMFVALSAGAFEQHLRLIAMRWLLRDAPPPFRRAVWMEYLANGLASAAQIDSARLSALVANVGGSTIEADPVDPAALAREIERGGPGNAALLRSLAKDPALLLQVTGAMREGEMMAVLASFGAVGAEADLALLANRHAEAPLAALSSEAFQHLTCTLAIAALASGERFRRAGLRRYLLEGIARHQGVSVREIGDWRQLEHRLAPPSPPSPPEATEPDALTLAEHFLRAGRPSAHVPNLTHAAAQDPAEFAALLRRLTVAASGETGPLIKRLLEWMLPEEIVATLAPGSADRAVAWASHLADMPGGSMAAAWTQLLDAALRGEAFDIADPPVPGERHDRLALLRHWLEHGTLPWWAPPGARAERLLAHLAEAPMPELHRLFDNADADGVAARLRRAIDRLGPTQGAALIERLAPRASATTGPLAHRSPDRSTNALDSVRIRAAAAAIIGAPFDQRGPTRPLPAPKTSAEPERMPPAASADQAALFAWLAGAGPENPPRLAIWLRLLAELADRDDPALDVALRSALVRPEARTRWTTAMPEEIFARVIHRLAPGRARFLLDAAVILATVWRRTAPPAMSGTALAALRARLLSILMEDALPSPSLALDKLLGSLPKTTSDIEARAQAAELARSGGYANVLAVLNRPPEKQPSHPVAARATAPNNGRPPEPETGDHIYVANAGLVLFNPFLPRFFERIGVLTPDAQAVPRITGVEAASRAVHLLQYLVDGRCDTPEPELALNKLLSGVPLAAPVSRAIDLTEADRTLCDQLIQATIANWPSIGNTSAAGLRETFLQRAGRLRREEDRWTLDVERKTLDVLVDQIPWNRALVYHRWMTESVHVNW